MRNPLLSLETPLPFTTIESSHLVPAIRQLLAEAEARVAAITSENATYATTLGELGAGLGRLQLAVGIVEHLENVATTPAFRAAHNLIVADVGVFFSSLTLRENVWNAILAYSRSDEARIIPKPRQRFLAKTMLRFGREGARLGLPDKERLREMEWELALITTKYSQNLQNSSNAFELLVADKGHLKGLPELAIQSARLSASSKGVGGYRITLQEPSVTSVLKYADDAALRERIWVARNSRARSGEVDNRPLVARILDLRRQKAQLLGFSNFADLVAEDRMARTGTRAQEFVDDLTSRTLPDFERENSELEEWSRVKGGATRPLRPWDVPYYAEKYRRVQSDFDEEELRRYFAADQVVEGAFRIAERLFDIVISSVDGYPVWDPQVRVYRISEASGREAAVFYVDLYTRENKRSGGWMHGLATATQAEAPIAVLCANAGPPNSGGPSLLTHREAQTIFHEFGHLLHHCLGKVEVHDIAGAPVDHDFRELPSQMMENWCWEREGLDIFARHHITHQPIPRTMLEQLQSTRAFRSANAQMGQLGYAAVDLALHRTYDPPQHGEPERYARAIFQRYVPTILPDDFGLLEAFPNVFGEPFGYAAGYYSYKWAEVLEADAFGRFMREGILSKTVGDEFRRSILARGDNEASEALFVRFMGRPPSLEALMERQQLGGRR